MKAVCVLVVLLGLASVASAFERQCMSMDHDWRFQLGSVKNQSMVIDPAYDDSNWRLLNVPHDFVVEGVFNPNADKGHGFMPANVSYYRRTFTLTEEQQSNGVWWLEFDGVYRASQMWLNGKKLGTWASGYVGFRYNLTQEFLVPAGQDNVLVVYVDATYFEGWWYEGGGIYRHVRLCGAEPLYVPPQGVSVAGLVTGTISGGVAAAAVTVNTTVWNVDTVSHTFTLVSSIIDATGSSVAQASVQLTLAAGKATAVSQVITLAAATLWSLENPYLYTLQSHLTPVSRHLRHRIGSRQTGTGAAVTALEGDTVSNSFGIRKLFFDVNNGFYLNDQFVKIKGFCNHQDFAGTGVAMPYSVHEFRLRMLKDMGANAVRASHNAQAPEFLELCDKIGLLVWDEERLYNGIDSNTMAELTGLVTLDRNHPSVFMWSLCNEYSCGDAKTFQPLYNAVKALDGDHQRPITAAMNHGWFDSGSMSTILDVIGFNYNIGEWTQWHTQYPKVPMTGSETSSAITTRGIYADNSTAGYLSAYDVHQPGWGNFAWEAWQAEVKAPYMEGGFIWTGFDYKGEPTPYGWPCINSHFGAIDIAGFPKDNYFYYLAWWQPQRPMVHILPHWTWPSSQVGKSINVWVYSAGAYVELILNGKSLGIKAMPANFHVEWNVNYAPGTLQAIAYDSTNKTWAEETLTTTGSPAAIELSIENFSPTTLMGDGQDTTLVTIQIVDSDGLLVPTAGNRVQFEVTGAGSLLGVGSGDPSCHDSDKANFRYAFNGYARALVQASLLEPGTSDTVTLTATSPGLTSASIDIPVQALSKLALA